ncbi:DUF4291 domain-containing protein [Streptomyces sp. NPDC048254]|uniref:DUF4291 domain-containing protein n=1 Tax=Streptomyces sp. NPDC048254 TaxID=3365525 RepID=UPI00371A003A
MGPEPVREQPGRSSAGGGDAADAAQHTGPRPAWTPTEGKGCEHGLIWIKPSFLWMMYRCGWGGKAGQETVLAVEISRDGFEWALRYACLSGYAAGVHPGRAAWQRQLKRAPARVQWDPERDLRLQPLPYRSLQLGLSGEAVRRYADEWTVAMRDVTPLAHEIHALVSAGDLTSATRLLPQERPYPAEDASLAHLLE